MKKESIKLPPKPTHKCVDETAGKIIGYDMMNNKPIYEGEWVLAEAWDKFCFENADSGMSERQLRAEFAKRNVK